MVYLTWAGQLSVVLFAIGISWYIKFVLTRRRLYKLAATFNGPPPLPIIGNILSCFIPLTDIITSVLESITYYKSPQRLWFGPKLIVHIFEPQDVKIVLNSPHALAKEPHLYKLLEFISGRGLGVSPVDEWKRHRKMIAPCFNQKIQDGFFDTFCYHSKKLVCNLEVETANEIFDAEDYVVKYALNSVTDTLLGVFDDDKERVSNFNVWTKKLLVTAVKRSTSIWYFSDIFYNMTSLSKTTLKIKNVRDRYIDSIIEKWRTGTFTNSRDDNSSHITESPRPTKLIEHLLAISDAKGKFTSEELRAEILTLISGGLETMSSLLGFLLVLLGMHPELQEKVYKEVEQIMGSKVNLELEDLKDLQYLECVIKEGMRLYPLGAGLVRHTDKEIQLQNNIIPSDTTVIIGLMSLHRNPDIWPNPNKFDPDRFHPDEEAKRHPYSWIPFSGGPRNCIGMRYAWTSLKVVMSDLIMKYKITTDYKSVEDIRLTLLFKLQPTHGFRIGIKLR